MAIEDLRKDINKMLDLSKTICSMNQSLLGTIKFQQKVIRYLYQDRFTHCDDPLGELKRLEKSCLDEIRFATLSATDDPKACLLIQEGEIPAGEDFFANLESGLKQAMEASRRI